MSDPDGDAAMMGTFIAGPLGALHPHARIVTGVEDDPLEPGAVRIYLAGHASDRRVYVLCAEDDAGEARRAWSVTRFSHLFLLLPDGAPIYFDVDEPDGS